ITGRSIADQALPSARVANEHPNSQLWMLIGSTSIKPLSIQNGGSARGYQSSLCTVGYPTTAEPTGGQAVCLCIASTGRDRASAADSESPELPRVGRSTSVSVHGPGIVFGSNAPLIYGSCSS